MKLCEVLNKFTNSAFLLSVEGLCDELYGGVETIKSESYYREYKDRTVKGIAILQTNGIPELCIRLWEV